MNGLAKLIATWFFLGYIPKGPGTAGSLGALLVALPLYTHHGFTPMYYGILAAAFTPVAIWASGRLARETGLKDPQIVVADEVAGQWLALAGATQLNPAAWILAFVLFRAFDIWKPPPLRRLEKLPGGMGIVMDDLGAGAYAALVLFAAGCFNLY